MSTAHRRTRSAIFCKAIQLGVGSPRVLRLTLGRYSIGLRSAWKALAATRCRTSPPETSDFALATQESPATARLWSANGIWASLAEVWSSQEWLLSFLTDFARERGNYFSSHAFGRDMVYLWMMTFHDPSSGLLTHRCPCSAIVRSTWVNRYAKSNRNSPFGHLHFNAGGGRPHWPWEAPVRCGVRSSLRQTGSGGLAKFDGGSQKTLPR